MLHTTIQCFRSDLALIMKFLDEYLHGSLFAEEIYTYTT